MRIRTHTEVVVDCLARGDHFSFAGLWRSTDRAHTRRGEPRCMRGARRGARESGHVRNLGHERAASR